MGRPKTRSDEYWTEWNKEYAKNNREKLNQTRARYRARNREKLAMSDRLRRYGVTLDWYNQIYEKQNGKCAICGKEIITYTKDKVQSVHIDHDKESGEVRGLLCLGCNLGLGSLQHDPLILKSAERYLRHYGY